MLFVPFCALLAFLFVADARADVARNARIEDYEGRQITAVELVFEGTANEPNAKLNSRATQSCAQHAVLRSARARFVASAVRLRTRG